MASITQLKQMRSSTGRLRTNHNNSPMPMQIIEGNPSYQSSSSVAAARQFYNPQQQVAACNALAQGQSATYARPVLGQGTRGRDMSFSGANVGWTATSSQPLIPPMYGELSLCVLQIYNPRRLIPLPRNNHSFILHLVILYL